MFILQQKRKSKPLNRTDDSWRISSDRVTLWAVWQCVLLNVQTAGCVVRFFAGGSFAWDGFVWRFVFFRPSSWRPQPAALKPKSHCRVFSEFMLLLLLPLLPSRHVYRKRSREAPLIKQHTNQYVAVTKCWDSAYCRTALQGRRFLGRRVGSILHSIPTKPMFVSFCPFGRGGRTWRGKKWRSTDDYYSAGGCLIGR